MTTSQELAKEANIKPRLQLGKKLEGGGVESTGAHKIVFVNDRTVKGSHPVTGAERTEVEYTLRENDTEKTYNVAVKNDSGELNYFVIRMAEFEYGNTLIFEMKKKGIKNYIDVRYDSEPTANEPIPEVQVDEDAGLGTNAFNEQKEQEIPLEEN